MTATYSHNEPHSPFRHKTDRGDTIVCPQRLAQILDLGDDLWPEIRDAFHDDVERRLEQIESALRLHDAGAIAAAAHSVKGMCGNIGAERMSALAIEIEERSDNGDTQAVAALLPGLRDSFEDVMQVIGNLSRAGDLREPSPLREPLLK